MYFNRWCTASNVKTLDDLKELMLLEQLKNSVSQRVATYISERKPDTAYEAAVMADEFSLIHKTSFGYKKVGENFQKESGYDPGRSSKLCTTVLPSIKLRLCWHGGRSWFCLRSVFVITLNLVLSDASTNDMSDRNCV